MTLEGDVGGGLCHAWYGRFRSQLAVTELPGRIWHRDSVLCAVDESHTKILGPGDAYFHRLSAKVCYIEMMQKGSKVPSGLRRSG
jgi:hypothetical protein